ncbi:MAG: bifunctional oligoribonuclease/PAP phosphatase NrnA [Bacillota bacterium]
MNSLSDVARELKAARRLVFTGHVMPDGDCIGSMLALGLVMEREGKEVIFVSPGPVPSIYRFLPGVERVKVNPALSDINPGDGSGLVVIVDTSVPARLGDFLAVVNEMQRSGYRTILLDHHISALPYADSNYIDPGAAAVGEIVFDLIKLLGHEIDQAVATCLYVTLATDTGGFRYETTTPQTHRKVADLIEAGVDVRAISLQIFEEKPLKSFEVLRTILNTLELSPCGRIGWFTLNLATANHLQVEDEHIDGVVNYARQVRGVEIALLFREVDGGYVKVSFRSKNYVDVSKLAAEFGGGGHPRAAGALVKGKIDEIRKAVLDAGMASLERAEAGN